MKCTFLTRTLANLSDKQTPLKKKNSSLKQKLLYIDKIASDLFLIAFTKYCNLKSEVYKIHFFETEDHTLLFPLAENMLETCSD